MKSSQKTVGLNQVIQNLHFPLRQYFAKPEEAIPGSKDQKRACKLATNIESRGSECEFHNFCP